MKSKKPLEPSEKKLFLLCGLIFALIFGGIAFWNALEAEPNWNIPAPLPTPNPNGFDLYVAAANAIVPANPPVDQVNDPTPVQDPKVYAQKYSLAKKNAWLKTNTKAFTLFRQATQTPTLHPQDEIPFAVFGKLRELARSKVIEGNAHKMEGDWDGAMQSALDTVQMGHEIRRGGPLIASLVGIAIGAIGRGFIWDVPEKMSASGAKEAARRLEKLLEQRVRASDTWKLERAEGLRRMRETMKTSGWRQLDEDWGLTQRVRVRLTSKRQVVADYERILKNNIANTTLPYSMPATLIVVNPAHEKLADISIRYRFNDARDQAGDILLMLRLALQAFRLEKGHYPTQLSELTPNYLGKIPLDPFANAPLGYKKIGRTYLLWSIGPDGKNDGGSPIPYKSKPTPGIPLAPPSMLDNSTDDYVAGKNR